MLVEIKQKHINLGQRGKCEFCPITLAMKELFPDKFITVGVEFIMINGKNYNHNGRWFIDNFDVRKVVGPTTVTVHGL